VNKADKEYMALLAKRAYDLEVQLGLAMHYVGNVEGGDTEMLETCSEMTKDLRIALEDQARD